MTLKGPQKLQFGWGIESTYGTSVARDKFLPILSESLSYDVTPVEDEAIYAGELVRNMDQVGRGNKVIAGDIVLPLYHEGLRELLTLAMGVETGASSPFTYTPADLEGQSATIEIVRAGVTAEDAYIFDGCKIAKWSIDFRQGEPVTLTLSVVGQAYTAGAATAATYPTGLKFAVAHGMTVSLTGGGAFNVKSGSVKGDNGLATDRFFADSDEIDEPLEAGRRTYQAEVVTELPDDLRVTQQAAATEVDLGLTWPINNGLPSATESLAVAMNGEVSKTSQGVSQRTGLIEETVSIMAAAESGGAAGDACTFTYTTTEV